MAIVGLGGEKLWLCPSLNDNPHDISGNGNNGTYNGGMGTVADVSKGGKRAYSFDGSDDYINTGNSVSPTSGISMCAWVSLDSLPSGSTIRTVIEKGYDGSKEPFVFTFAYGDLMAYTYNGAVHGTTVSYSSLSASTWYHIVSTFDGSTWKIYIDGTLSASTNNSTALQANTQNVLVGAATISGSVERFFDGLMDDIRIFDRPLTTAEIKHLAKARGITGTPLKKGLGDEKLWLCPSIDDSAEDLSGNGNNGTYNGGMGTVSLSGSGGSKAYDFDGVNDRIDCPADTLGGSSTLSVSCWVYQDSYDATKGNAFVAQVDVGSNAEKNFILYTPASVAGKAVRSIIYTNTSGSFAEAYWGSPPPPLNAWHHWCMTADGSTIRLYKDGVLVDSTAYSGSPPTSPTTALEIGRYKGGGNNDDFCLDGKMDDIRVFTRALTPTEITHLASARGVAGSPYGFEGLGGEKLWLCPTLDDSAEDISGNRNHGTYIAGMGTVADTSNGGTRAYSFNGTTHMLDVDSPPSITGSSASITYWCKSNDFVSWRSPGGYVTNGYDDYRLTFRKTNQSLVVGYARYSTGGIRATDYYSLNNFSYTDWTHYAVVANEGDVYFYVDGVLAATGTGGSGGLNLGSTFTLGSQDLRVGGSWWNGYIDDCRVYDRAITQEEVTHLAKSRGVLGSPHNLNGIVHLLSSFIHPFT